MIITRFAPSPTGYLHVGNVRTALVNYLFTKANGGKFILRIDDTDRERSKDEYVEGIKQDLTWLGLEWDEIFYQSKRMEKYEAAKEKMIASGRLYPCYESHEELEVKKKTLLSRNLPPIYDRSALKLTEAEKKKFEEQGIKPHWRFKLEGDVIEWEDGVRGRIHFETKHISDPVVIRADGTMTYMIATVVDDIDLKISQIIRGEDHISNSAVHIQMFEALGATPPHFAHLSLLKSKEGEMSKRVGGFDIRALRESGIHPMAILSMLAKMGTSDPIEFKEDLQTLVKEFALSKFGKATANYDLAEVERVNSKLLHHISFAQIKPYLTEEIDESFWLLARGNLKNINEIADWWKICRKELAPIIEDKELLELSATLLPTGNWDQETWNTWINAVKEKSGKGGKALFMPIRLALTGMDNGPELKYLLPHIGYEKAKKRLTGQVA